MDQIARALTFDGFIRAYAILSKDMVQKAVTTHDCYPTTAAALGRAMTAAAMMGTMMKENEGSLTLQIDGGGPAGRIVAVADNKGRVKAYVDNPHVDLPSNAKGKLDVGGVVGKDGYLSVIRDMGLKEPYIGQTPLVSGEIAEDITAYFAYSEQTPTAVALTVLVDTDYSIKAAGGFLLQVMPGATEDAVSLCESIVEQVGSVTKLVAACETAEDMIEHLFGDTDYFLYENLTPSFFCDCSRQRLERVLLSLGKKELTDMIETDGQAELTCHFCNEKYHFDKKQLESLLAAAQKE